MCGRTIRRHRVTVAVDYKIPIEWGGRDHDENLWAICEDCSIGKAENFQDDESAFEWIGNSFAHDIIRAAEECRS